MTNNTHHKQKAFVWVLVATGVIEIRFVKVNRVPVLVSDHCIRIRSWQGHWTVRAVKQTNAKYT